MVLFFFQAEDGIRDDLVTGVQTCALPICRLRLDELFIETQPAHLQKSSQQKLNAEERDHLRAQIIRERLKLFPKPDISKMRSEERRVGKECRSRKTTYQ